MPVFEAADALGLDISHRLRQRDQVIEQRNRRKPAPPRNGQIVRIYLSENRAAANAFFTPDWVAIVTKRWAAPPRRRELETPMVMESAERRLVAAE